MGLPKTVRFNEELEYKVEEYLEARIEINKISSFEAGNSNQSLDEESIESAIPSLVHPGSYLFPHGRPAKVAGALTSITFLNMHGLALENSPDIRKNVNGLSEIVEACATSKLIQDQFKDWFEDHKVFLNE